MKNRIIIIGAITILVIGGGSFYAGMQYAQSKKTVGNANFANLSQADRQQRFSQMGGGQGGGRMGGSAQAGAGFINGEIIAKDDKSVTIKLGDGGSKIVFYSASTQVQKMADMPINDLVIGQQVVASGTVNSDGSVTAKTIQLRPAVIAPTASATVKPAGN